MAQKIINIGSVANDGTGDTIRGAFTNVNANFTEVYNTVIETGIAFDTANAAFAVANNISPQVAPSYNTANNAYNTANAAYTSGNASYVMGNANYTTTNIAFNTANAAYAAALAVLNAMFVVV